MWSLIREAFSRFFAANAPRLGAALAYYTVLSLAPLLVVVVGIVGIVFGRAAAEGQIVAQLQDLVGQKGAQAVQSLMQNAFKPAAGVTATLVGIVALLFGASGAFVELRSSLNTLWSAQAREGNGVKTMVKERFFSFAMVVGIGFLLLVSLAVSAALAAAGTFVGNRLPVPAPLLEFANMVVSFAVTTVLFSLIYKVVPDVRIAWRDVWLGGAITALLFSAGKLLIGLYLGKASIGSAYGAAGSVVIILVWVYYSAQVFFLGAEFTRLFAERYGSLSPAARRRAPSAPPRAA